MDNRIRASKRFYYLKTLDRDSRIEYLEKFNMRYHLNEYMDLTMDNYLDAIENYSTITEYRKALHNDYDSESAESWYWNLVDVLGGQKNEIR